MNGLKQLVSATLLVLSQHAIAGTATANAEIGDQVDLNFAQVVSVKAEQNSDGRWCFQSTIRHQDEGWQHYADLWQVRSSTGEVLAERVLAHPHDTEQPFTRSQCGVVIDKTITEVEVRARCTVHGFSDQSLTLQLNVEDSPLK